MEQKQQICRIGMFTASSIYKLMAKSRSKDKLFGDTAMTYINEKIAEIITGERAPQISSKATDWGHMYEADAAAWFKAHYHDFDYYGGANFVFNEYNDFSGASPDGLYDNGVIEFKCPFDSANHVGFMRNKSNLEWLKLKHNEYYAQVQFNMMCAGKSEAKLCSYDPRTVEPKHRMAVLHVPKDEAYCQELDMRINEGVKIIKKALESL